MLVRIFIEFVCMEKNYTCVIGRGVACALYSILDMILYYVIGLGRDLMTLDDPTEPYYSKMIGLMNLA